MKFNIHTWRKLYDEAQSLHPVHDAKRIEEIKQRVSQYMDSCGLFMPDALWHYDADDKSHEKESWKWIPSTCSDPFKAEEWTILNPNFAYDHLCT